METQKQNNLLYHLHLTGHFQDTGFGFSCLKQVSVLQLTGNLRYISEREIEMNLKGNQEQVTRFLSWCRSSPETATAIISEPMSHLIGLTEFDIINSL